MAKRKRKQKPKRGHYESQLNRQLESCGTLAIKLSALVLMLACICMMVVVLWLQTVFPAFDPTIWLVISGLFTYLSGYLFLNSDDDDDPPEKRKNDWLDEDEDDFYDDDSY